MTNNQSSVVNNDDQKRVIFLVGPKGSGKSYIGGVLDTDCPGVTFLSVEPLFLSVKDQNDGWALVERAVDDIIHHRAVVGVHREKRITEEDEKKEPTTASSNDNASSSVVIPNADNTAAVVLESLGGGAGFNGLVNNLRAKQYRIDFIKVSADLDTCLHRVKSRDPANHIPVPLDKVRYYNELAAKVELDWSGTIDNNGPAGATHEEIIQAVEKVLNKDK